MDVRQYNNEDKMALASAIYGEARNQNSIGKAAVGHSVLTRAALAGVPVSDVVYGSISPKYGQYSFANPQDPNARTVANAPENDPEGWADAVAQAEGILDGSISNPVPGATNYATTSISPKWARSAEDLGVVDDHRFYALPDAEVAGLTRRAAASPNRRGALVESEDDGPRQFNSPERLDDTPRTISAGEFDFASPKIESGFARMTPGTQFTASEMARTLPDDQRMTVTATHGQHGLSNLTHTPGAAFDVRTRDLSVDQKDDLVDSALYSRPASIGWNDGTGSFPAHMHVDTNAGYGSGLQSHSSMSDLSDYAKQELARYDAEMESGLGYTPPVPESIAPVPSPSPLTAPEVAEPAAVATLAPSGAPAGGLGVQTHQVQSMRVMPDGTMVANTPTALGTTVAETVSPTAPETIGPIDDGIVSSVTAEAPAGLQAVDNTAISLGSLPSSPIASVTAEAPAGLQAVDNTAISLASPSPIASISAEAPAGTMAVDNTAISMGDMTPSFDVDVQAGTAPTIGEASVNVASLPGQDAIDNLAADVQDQREINEAAARQPVQQPAQQPTVSAPEVKAPSVTPTRSIPSTPAAPSRPKSATGSDVWGGRAAEGIATDGSKLTRNPDGSISRYSSLSGKTERVSDAVQGWDGPSLGDTKQPTGGFWSGAAERAKSIGGALGGTVAGAGAVSDAERNADKVAGALSTQVKSVQDESSLGSSGALGGGSASSRQEKTAGGIAGLISRIFGGDVADNVADGSWASGLSNQQQIDSAPAGSQIDAAKNNPGGGLY